MKHHYTFTGREAVDFIVSRMGVNRETAVFIGNKMMQARVFRHVTNSYTFCDEPGKYYCFAKPENSALHLPQPLSPFVGHIIIETLMLEPSCPKDALFTVVCDNQKFKVKAIGRPTEEQQSPKATTKNRKKKPAVTKEEDDTSSIKKRSGSRISAQRNKLVNTIKLRKTSRANNNNRASTIQVLEKHLNSEETINKNEKANKRKAAADALVQSFARLTSSPTFQDTLRSYLLLSWGDTVYGEEVLRDEDDNKKRTEKNFFSKAEEQKLAEMVAPWLLNNQQNKTSKRLRLKKRQPYREKKQRKEDGDKEDIMVRSYEEQRPHIKASQSLSLPTLPLLSAGTRTPTTPPNTSDDDEDGEDFKEDDDVVVMNVEFNAHGENGDDVETENFCSVLSDNKLEETGEAGGEQEEAEENRTSTEEDLSSSSASSTQTSQENVEDILSSPTPHERNADDSNGKIRKGQKTSSSSSPPASPSSDSITDLHMIVFWPNSELTVSFQCSSHASGKVHIPLSDLKNNGELQELRLPITTTRRKSVDVGTSSASSFSSSSGSLSPTTTFSNSTDSTENQPTLLIRLRYTHNATDDGFALPPLPFDNYSVQLRTESRLTRYNVFKTAGHRPNHRCCDRNNVFPVLDELEEPYPADKLASANGVFWYGIGSLTNANVELFVQEDFRKEDWTWIGSGQTDKRGKVVIPIPPDASSIQRKPGHYPVRMVVPKDRSVAAGSLWILRKGTGAVVFDIDGTLTTGDIQVVTQTGLNLISVNFDPTPQSGAVALVRAWAAKGYLPIYLSGRAGAFYKLTRNWLIEHGLPPGLIGHTETHKPTVPLWASVGRFKRDYIRDLIDKYGLQIGGVYGNTKTDIKAYEQMGMAKDKTFICGKFGGRKGTVDVGNDFNAHIKYVMENIPPATIPAPLSWTSY
ncbi:LNS2 domain-containing protein [Balamuthia mandrillaris]